MAAPHLVAPTAGATIQTIQPGDRSVSADGAGCTLNFVFDGVGALAGNVYIGTAAHCVSRVDESVSSWPYDDFGTVAYLGDEGRAATDFAFIEVKPAFHHLVDPAVKGHPSYPTGVTTAAETRLGDEVQMSGYGTGFGMTSITQERRIGALTDDDADIHQVAAPVVWGDSGGPLVHVSTGKALGIVSRLCAAWTCTEYGPTIEGILAKAEADGFPVELRPSA